MAVVATFRADFSDFMKKAQAAQGSLDAMASAAGVTAGRVSKVGNSFSGERLIREASAAALAVQEIGGASKLTDAEMARVNRTTGEALAKMKALGLEAPPEIARLNAETQRAATSTGALAEKTSLASKVTSGFTGAIGQMAAAFSVSALIDRTVGAIADFGAAAIQSAGVLTDLRNKTGLSLSLLQEMQVVAEQTGTSIDVLTNASYQLSLRLASNTDVLSELGLAYADLRDLSPDEQFRKVFRALEDVDDIQERARIGAELYGSKVYKEIAPAVTEGWANIAGAIKKSNDAQLEAIDASSDRFTQFRRDVTTAFTGVIGNFLLARDELSRLDDQQQQHLNQLTKLGGDAQGYLLQLAQQRLEAEKAAQPVEQKRTEIVRDYVRELAAQQEKIKALTPTTIAQIDAARSLGASEEDLIRQFGVSATTLKLLTEQQKETAKATKEYENEVKKAREAQEKWEKSVKSLAGNFVELQVGVQDSGEAIRNAAQGFMLDGTLITNTINETANATAEARKETEAWARATGAVLAPSVEAVSPLLDMLATKTTSLGGTIKGSLSASFTQLPQTILSAFQGGGNVVKSVGSLFGSGLGSSLVQNFGGNITKMLGPTMGAALNSVLPGLGALMGPLLGAVSGKLVGMFGGIPAEVQKVRGEISAFEETLRKNLTTTQAAEAAGQKWAATTIAVRDAYLATGRSAAEAEAIVRQLWDDKNPTAARAAIEQINKVLAEAKQAAEALQKGFGDAFKEAIDAGITLPDSMQGAIQSLIDMGKITGDNVGLFAQLTGNNQAQFDAMEKAAKKYGVELSALGPAFAQNRLDQQATAIIEAFGAMTRGGGDVSGVIAGMSDEINTFVGEAIKSGRTVPENMRPILQTMIEQGKLTDENGKKLNDLGGINFGPPIESAFDRIIAKLQELIDKLTGGAGFDKAARAADDFARQATDAVNRVPREVTVRFRGEGDDIDGNGTPGYARGTKATTGSWFRNFGGGTVTRLHGDEAVVPRGQAAAFAEATGVGGMSDAVAAEVAGLRSDFALLPQMIGRAVRDAVLVAG